MKLDIANLRICELLGMMSREMSCLYYPWRDKPRASDCIAYVLEGHAVYRFQDYEFEVKKGDLFVVTFASQYSIYSSPEYELWFADCMFENRTGSTYNSCVLPIANKQELEKYVMELMKMSKHWSMHNPAMRMRAISLIYGMFSCMLFSGEERYIGNNAKDRLKIAEKRIIDGYADPDFECNTLGSMIGMSEVHFRRLFLRMYGVTPKQYLISYRMNVAKSLLAQGEISIAEIAARIGYNSVCYFSRAFKKECGVSPTEFKSMIY